MKFKLWYWWTWPFVFTRPLYSIKYRTIGTFNCKSYTILTFIISITSLNILIISICFSIAWWQITKGIIFGRYSIAMNTLTFVNVGLFIPFFIFWTPPSLYSPPVQADHVRWTEIPFRCQQSIFSVFAFWETIFAWYAVSKLAKVIEIPACRKKHKFGINLVLKRFLYKISAR